MSKQAKFDRDDVIEKAKNLYWQKGYHATSMRNLQDVVDMRPGSIYAAFGSKDNLFKEALNRYAQESNALLSECMAQEPEILQGLKRFLRIVTTCNKGTAPNSMCMMVKTVGELTDNDNPELLAIATGILERVETSFTDFFQRAIDNGEINKEKDPAELARNFQIQIIGLRTYAQIKNSEEAVDKFIENIFKELH
jgi:AcrR family transcriptional regulator